MTMDLDAVGRESALHDHSRDSTHALVAQRPGMAIPLGAYDPSIPVHAEQRIVRRRPPHVADTVRAGSKVSGIHKKGCGALAAAETLGWLTGGPDDALRITSRSAFIGRGEDGFCIEQPAAP